MIDCNFIRNELGKYVGDVNCIEYEIEICHKYLKIPEWIKTKGSKFLSLKIQYCKVMFEICVIDRQSYPSLCHTPFSVNSITLHNGL